MSLNVRCHPDSSPAGQAVLPFSLRSSWLGVVQLRRDEDCVRGGIYGAADRVGNVTDATVVCLGLCCRMACVSFLVGASGDSSKGCAPKYDNPPAFAHQPRLKMRRPSLSERFSSVSRTDITLRPENRRSSCWAHQRSGAKTLCSRSWLIFSEITCQVPFRGPRAQMR